MPRWVRAFLTLCFVLSTAAVTVLFAQDQANEFRPVTAEELAQQEQIPAASLVFAAYAFVWVCFIVYLFLLWQKMRRVEVELGEVRSKLGGGRR